MRLRSVLSTGACAAGALVLYVGATPALAEDWPVPGRHDVQFKQVDLNAGLNNGSTQRGLINSANHNTSQQRSDQRASKVDINKDDSYPTAGEIQQLIRNKAGSPK